MIIRNFKYLILFLFTIFLNSTLSAEEMIIGEEKIEQYGVVYNADRFTLKSKDMTLQKDKRLDFNIWYDKKTGQIIRVSYSRMGNWEYRLRSFE